MNTQAMSDRYRSSFTDTAASMSARWRPEYSSTIASWTMVSSRCVAGLSTGMRAFSAIATMMSATRASASEMLRPAWGPSMKEEIEESSVEPAKRESVNTAISIAGSASVANIISRLDPMPPKLVPTSSPASASMKRAVPSSATMTMRSAAAPSARPVAKVGTRAAATQVLAKTAYGAVRNSHEALPATTTSLRMSLRRSR